MRTDPKPEDAIDFWRVMMARYGVTLLDLNLPADRHTVYNGLNKMGMGSDALKYYALTFGTRMYLPFEIGKPREDWSLWEQIKCCLHEHFHVGQQRQYEGKEFALIYESNATARAYFRGGGIQNRHDTGMALSGAGVRPKGTSCQTLRLSLRGS
jgi:hypothetical protein